MINATTVNKLNEMRLPAMAETFRQQLQDSAFDPLSFEERFSLIVDIEWARRKNNRLTKLIRAADFQQSDACIENIEYMQTGNSTKRKLPAYRHATTSKKSTM